MAIMKKRKKSETGLADKSKAISDEANDVHGRLNALGEEGVEFGQIEFSDIHGILRGKIAHLKALGKGTTASGGLLSTISNDEIVPTPMVRLEHGTDKFAIVPDYSTLKKLNWRGDTASVIAGFYEFDGQPHWADPRHILKNAQEKIRTLGYETKVGLELEFFLYEDDEDLLRNGRHKELLAHGRDRHAYSLGRLSKVEEFGKDFIRRMDDIGVEVEAFHTEYGVGMYEAAFAPLSALEAADAWVRAKVYIKETCARAWPDYELHARACHARNRHLHRCAPKRQPMERW